MHLQERVEGAVLPPTHPPISIQKLSNFLCKWLVQ